MQCTRSLFKFIFVLVTIIMILLSSTAAFLFTNVAISSTTSLSTPLENMAEGDFSDLPYSSFLENLFFYDTFSYEYFSLETISAFIDYDRDVLLQYDGIDVNRQLIDIHGFNWNASVLQNTTIGFYGSLGHLTMNDLPDYFPYFFPTINNLNNNGLLIVASPKPLDEFKQDIRQIEVILDPLNLSLSFFHCSWTKVEKQTLSFAVWHAHVSQALLASISANKGLANLLNSSQISMTQKNDLSIAFLRSSFTNNYYSNYSFKVRVQYNIPNAAEDNKFYSKKFIDPISPNRDHNVSLGIVVAPPSSDTELDASLLSSSNVRPAIGWATVDPWFDGESINLINPLILPLNQSNMELGNPFGIFDGPQFIEVAIYNIHIKVPETNEYVNIGFSQRTDVSDLGFVIEKAPYFSPLTPTPTAELQLEMQSIPSAETNQTIEITVTATNQGSKAAFMPFLDSQHPQEYGIFISFSDFPYNLLIDDHITLNNTTYPLSGDFIVFHSCLEKEMLLYANSFSLRQDALEITPIYPDQSQSWNFMVSSDFSGELEISSAYASYLSVEKGFNDSQWVLSPFPPSELNRTPFLDFTGFISKIPIPFPLFSKNIPTYSCFSISNSLEVMIETKETTSTMPSPFFVGDELYWELLIITCSLFLTHSVRKKKKVKV